MGRTTEDLRLKLIDDIEFEKECIDFFKKYESRHHYDSYPSMKGVLRSCVLRLKELKDQYRMEFGGYK